MNDNQSTLQAGRVHRVDKFVVPEHARTEFLDRVRMTHEFLRTLPGFVQDLVLERFAGPGEFNFVTVVEWDGQASLQSARAAVTMMHVGLDFDPQEMFARLGIRADRGNYREVVT